MLNKNKRYDWLKVISLNPANHMQITAEKLLNPYCYHLSSEAKKRLRWLYILYHDQAGNVTRAANKIGISRPWLSKIKSIFENSRRDPRSLEPRSKAPRHTSNRKRIPINKRWLIWHYTNKNVASLNFWQRSHEAIICAWKDKPIFNRDEIREPYTDGFLNGGRWKGEKGNPGEI